MKKWISILLIVSFVTPAFCEMIPQGTISNIQSTMFEKEIAALQSDTPQVQYEKLTDMEMSLARMIAVTNDHLRGDHLFIYRHPEGFSGASVAGSLVFSWLFLTAKTGVQKYFTAVLMMTSILVAAVSISTFTETGISSQDLILAYDKMQRSQIEDFLQILKTSLESVRAQKRTIEKSLAQ